MNDGEKKQIILDRAKNRAEQCADIAQQHSGNVAALYKKAARMFRALARREVSDDKDDLLAASEAAEDVAGAATKEASVLRRCRFG